MRRSFAGSPPGNAEDILYFAPSAAYVTFVRLFEAWSDDFFRLSTASSSRDFDVLARYSRLKASWRDMEIFSTPEDCVITIDINAGTPACETKEDTPSSGRRGSTCTHFLCYTTHRTIMGITFQFPAPSVQKSNLKMQYATPSPIQSSSSHSHPHSRSGRSHHH